MVSSTSDPRPWLLQAVEEHPGLSDQRYREEEPDAVLPGDICVVGPFDPAASVDHRLGMVGHLFVVIDETGDEGWFTGMLAGTETELATEVDAILEPECSGLGYEIVVHSRYRGPLWTVQVRRRVGAVDDSVLSELDELSYRDEPVGVSLRRGLPLQPEGIDPRYPALRTLSEELDNLTDHCRRRRHDLGAPILDPAVGKASVLEVLLAETGWKERIASVRSSTAFRDHLLDSFSSLTRDQQYAAMPLLDLALLAEAPVHGMEVLGNALQGHVDPDALTDAISGSTDTGPVIRVTSHRLCWRTGTSAAIRCITGSGRRLVIMLPSSDAALSEAT